MSKPTADAAFPEEQPPSEKPKYKRMSYSHAVIGRELHNYWGGKVIEHTSASGDVLALKVKTTSGLRHSEADLMHYASTHGVLAPKVYGVYDVQTSPKARVMVSDRVPGVPLVDIWQTATKAEQASYKEQLRTQLARMRACTQPFIGRVKLDGTRQPTYNVFDRLPRVATSREDPELVGMMGPFDDEKAFDDWCLDRVVHKVGFLGRYKWPRFIERERGGSSGRFVLTHGDLTPRNIMAKDGVITGIIDWQRGGFLPEYAEYALAMKLSPGIESWWVPVLEEILQPCSKDRLKFTKLVEFRGW